MRRLIMIALVFVLLAMGVGVFLLTVNMFTPSASASVNVSSADTTNVPTDNSTQEVTASDASASYASHVEGEVSTYSYSAHDGHCDGDHATSGDSTGY